MSKRQRTWLLNPTFPAPAALPLLDEDAAESFGPSSAPVSVVRLRNGGAASISGTWAFAADVAEPEQGEPRLARSATDAPTVRPGSLHAVKAG